jgi:hypothetical protein
MRKTAYPVRIPVREATIVLLAMSFDEEPTAAFWA